jgi:hypothetical protein
MRAVALLLVAVTACAYDAPWAPGSYGPNGPYSRASPGRITLNPGADRTPAWLAQDTAVLYSVERGDPPHDRCLGVLSAQRWTQERWLCPLHPTGDTTLAFEWPTLRPDGRLAYQRAVWTSASSPPLTRSIALATLAQWDAGQILVTFAATFGGVGPSSVDGARDLAWLADTSLVFVRERMTVGRSVPGGPIDTSFASLEIDRLDFGSATPVLTVVPGTAGATSVAVSDSATAIYYTLPGDSIVYRRQLAAGIVDTAYAFAGVVPGDVRVRGARLVAVIGGDLHLVDLAAATETVVSGSGIVFGHPALSHDGHRIVVEGTASGAEPDLWRVDWP